MAPREAVVVGFDYHARYLARVLNDHSENWRVTAFPGSRAGTIRALWALRRADVLISFGGPGPSIALAEAAQVRRIPILVVWAGSDVQIAAGNPFELAVTKRRGYDNVAVAPWLVDELRVLGIEARRLAVAAIDVGETIAPLPTSFRVLTYLPEPRRTFYGEERVYALARRLPDVEFTVLGAGGRNPQAPANVAFAGYVDDVAAYIDGSSVLLRLTEHDGASVIVLEALARGRHAVWTHDYPGVRCVSDGDQAFAAMAELYEAHRAGALAPNLEGREFVQRHFASADIACRFESHLDELAASRPSRDDGRHRTVAISGLGLFSAEVAANVERLRPEWKAHVLSTNSRLEVLAAIAALARSDVWYSIGSPITDRWVNLWAKLWRKPRVIHWVGSDIELLRQATELQRRLCGPSIKHLTEVDWTKDELRSLGLSSDIVPLPLRHAAEGVKPLPDRFTMLLYLPKSRPDFYGRGDYEALLEEFAGEPIRVFVVGGGTLRVPPAMECVNLGWHDDLTEVFEQSTLLIRLTPRDGLSLMVLETLSFGRYAMWTKPFPYTTHVRSRSDLSDGLRRLLERHRAGTLQAQYAASEMVRRRYSTNAAVDQILRAWESVS